ncbi:M-phase inducer phosphatase [Plakobranchus ocellatus]|uniref:M-phase inducer phosphatase n=1 Tax=Plakobranchus ocellatus TaxID=259542 RepID=A0AAV3Z210_9GAST|nr:M-phase inducer phosphatase [Plakobranchus ocellatus]
MSKRLKQFNLPLKNITSVLNSRINKMSYNGDSAASSLTNSPMSNLAFNLSELSTGKSSPRLRRKLSLSSMGTPPYEIARSENEPFQSAESGCFSGSSLDDSPTLESLSLKRYTAEQHPDIPLEAFSVKKRTISFRRISSEPPPTLRLDSPTDFLEEDEKDDEPVFADKDKNEERPAFCSYGSDETCSQDSGLGMEHDRLSQLSQRSSTSSFDDGCSLYSSTSSLAQLDRLPSLEDVWNSMDSPSFKAPQGKPPKRRNSLFDEKHVNEETCSPIKYSPVKGSSFQTHRPAFSKSLFSQIPEVADEVHEQKDPAEAPDGFKELFTLDDINNEGSAQVSSLISATLLHQPGIDLAEEEHPSEFKKVTFMFNQEKNSTPSSRPAVCRRGLHRSQSLDIRRRPSIKRSEPSDFTGEDFQSKKFRSNCNTLGDFGSSSNNSGITFSGNSDDSSTSEWAACPRRLLRCHSETEAMIKSAVSRMFEEPDLIGDCSKPYFLPTIRGKHQDLKSITPDTLAQLITQQYTEDVEEFHIIDCRYPYEYEGGHIKNALNLYTKDDVMKNYLDCPWITKDSNKRRILIFHCEFSAERGPGLFRFLRQKDRDTNKECYPFLHYPEIYLLEGGYKNFFENYPKLCEPQTYKRMLDKNHSEDLRKFRAKCKSWSDGKSQPRAGVRTLKF